ncbi:MAG: hypothetical protein ACI8PT_004359 [Gammaproteobacteria bacterium]|jgi:hypothetical protein
MSTMQSYFELRDVRALDGQTWIPLRQSNAAPMDPPALTIASLEEYTGIATAAVEDTHRTAAAKLSWSNGLDVDAHRVGVETCGYKSADIFRDWNSPLGINLVIDQLVEEAGRVIWHLHPDLVVALGLVREEDRWFRPEEGWAEVVRLERNVEDKPVRIEIRAEHLRDYLAARGMVLYCSSYRERVMVSSVRPPLSWRKGDFQEEAGDDRREGIITKAEYPDPEDHFWSRGALWRTEWIEAGTVSTRVRGDADPHISTFALANNGTRVPATTLGSVCRLAILRANSCVAAHAPSRRAVRLVFSGNRIAWRDEQQRTFRTEQARSNHSVREGYRPTSAVGAAHLVGA